MVAAVVVTPIQPTQAPTVFEELVVVATEVIPLIESVKTARQTLAVVAVARQVVVTTVALVVPVS